MKIEFGLWEMAAGEDGGEKLEPSMLSKEIILCVWTLVPLLGPEQWAATYVPVHLNHRPESEEDSSESSKLTNGSSEQTLHWP